MPDNTGIFLLGLGALLFLGRGTAGEAEEDNRLQTIMRGVIPSTGGPAPGGPAPRSAPAFDLQSYIDGLFRDTATAPVQPPVQFFYPADVVVTSSGVPAVVPTAPEIITPTTKVAIGGDGGETITASALAVKRNEELKKQAFEYSVTNVQPRTWAATLEANRIEEERQKKFAADLIAKNIAAQLARNQAVVARTRAAQEQLATPKVEERPPTINFYVDDDEWSMNPFATAGQPITLEEDDTDFIDVDFTPEYSESFEISGGMDSPGFASEDEQPSGETVHEITAAYDIGF